jgi:hypothetical protein
MLVEVSMMVDVEDVNDLVSIERGVTAAHREFPSAAMQAIVSLVQTTAENADPGRLRRKSDEVRTLWMTCGWARFQRRRYEDALEEKSYVLFDQRVGLKPYLRVTDAARKMLSALTAISPSFNTARQETEILLGDAPSTASLWSYTQSEGETIGAAIEERRKAVFEGGELPGADIPPKDFVGVETDSTMIDKWHAKGQHHEVYVGVAYDGKAVSRSGKRRRLTNRVAVTSLEGSATFGQDLFVAAQTKHNISEALTVHYASDGAEALETVRQVHFYRAEHQLDHCHVSSKAWDAYGWDHRDAADAVLKLIFGEKRIEFEEQITKDMKRFEGRRTKLAEYRDYILPRWSWIFATRRLAKAHPEVRLPPHIAGSGADERMVGELVGRRMKHRGMGWTTSGAANIMRVRGRQLGLQAF